MLVGKENFEDIIKGITYLSKTGSKNTPIFVIWTFESFLGDSRNNSSVEDQEHLALLVMEALTVLLQGSNTNAGNRSAQHGLKEWVCFCPVI